MNDHTKSKKTCIRYFDPHFYQSIFIVQQFFLILIYKKMHLVISRSKLSRQLRYSPQSLFD